MNKFNIGDKIKLPLKETGTIVKIKDIPWGFKYVVKIRKATFNKTNQLHEYKEEQMDFE